MDLLRQVLLLTISPNYETIQANNNQNLLLSHNFKSRTTIGNIPTMQANCTNR